MQPRSLDTPIFKTDALCAVELSAVDIPALQDFFEANPAYFIAVGGQPPGPNAAQEECDDELPAGWAFTKRWLIGIVDEAGAMIGMASIVSDLLVKNVWHIGLLVVATSLHGSGTASTIYDQLEVWMRGQGARWLRLGVVEGNAWAEHFWEKAGYIEVRKRFGVEMGARVNTLRVMAKPLAGGTLDEYLVLVTRDRPEANQSL